MGSIEDIPQRQDVNYSKWSQREAAIEFQGIMGPSRESKAEQELMARMWVLCAIEMQEKLSKANCTKPHFERYRSMLATEYERFKQPGYPQVPDSAELVAMDSETRVRMMNDIRNEVKGTEFWPMIEGPWRVHENAVDIVEGRLKLVKLLMQDNLLVKFYDWANNLSNIQPMFSAMGVRNPQLRVLEIGAGTGGTTDHALLGLQNERGEMLYSNYVFTDISTQFFDAAKARFAQYANVEYRALDISRDPIDQGFEAASFDLVIASNVTSFQATQILLSLLTIGVQVLHATPHIVSTLKNCCTLLRPDGFLFLQELSPPGKYVDFMVGMLPGWWLGEDDGRPNCPCLPPHEWESRLRQSGFDGLSAVAFDSDPPFYYNCNMLAKPAQAAD